MLNPGEGPISAVALYVPARAASPTHLFSGSVDGTLAVWSAGRTWDCLKVKHPPPPAAPPPPFSSHIFFLDWIAFVCQACVVFHVFQRPPSLFEALQVQAAAALNITKAGSGNTCGVYTPHIPGAVYVHCVSIRGYVQFLCTWQFDKISPHNIACGMALQGQPVTCQVRRNIFLSESNHVCFEYSVFPM